MSWRAAAKVKALTENLTRSEKLLLLILADYYNEETRRCDPSVARLARECLMSERTVQRTTKSLAAKGFIEIRDRHAQRRTNQYDLLCLEQVPACHQTAEDTGSSGAGDMAVTSAGDTAMSPEPKIRTVRPNRNGAVPRSPSGSSEPAPAAPFRRDFKANFFRATSTNARIAVVLGLWRLPLSKDSRAHLGSVLKRMGGDQETWDNICLAQAKEDPVRFLAGVASREIRGRRDRQPITIDEVRRIGSEF